MATLRRALSFILVGLLPIASAFAEQSSPIPQVTDGLRYAITPYLWMPSVRGTVDYDNIQVANVGMSSSQILQSLSTGAMLDGAIHYGRLGVIGNTTFAKLKPPGTQSYLRQQGVTINANTDLWLGVYTAAATYTVYAGEALYLDFLAGARFLNLNTKTRLDESAVQQGWNNSLTMYSSFSSTNAVGGVQGRIRLGETQFFIPFYLDAGGGGANTKVTSQQILGLGYTFSAADVLLVYNNLYYSLSKDNISAYVNMGGPAIAATFRF